LFGRTASAMMPAMSAWFPWMPQTFGFLKGDLSGKGGLPHHVRSNPTSAHDNKRLTRSPDIAENILCSCSQDQMGPTRSKSEGDLK
jgi:hypothetical protein